MTPVESASERVATTLSLKDGTSVMLRAVRPEDQGLLQELLESCSPTSLYHRFQYMTKRTRDLASRFCCIDESCENVLVAEIVFGLERRLIGFGNLAADPPHQSAEMAILVADHWQALGLGSALADHCLEAARRWGVKEVVAVTAPDNWRVIAMAKKHRFHILFRLEHRTVLLRKRFYRRRNRLSHQAA
jgi:acetyltransferase